MKLNARKTKVMHIGIGQYENISIDGVILERVDHRIRINQNVNRLTETSTMWIPGRHFFWVLFTY